MRLPLPISEIRDFIRCVQLQVITRSLIGSYSEVNVKRGSWESLTCVLFVQEKRLHLIPAFDPQIIRGSHASPSQRGCVAPAFKHRDILASAAVNEGRLSSVMTPLLV